MLLMRPISRLVKISGEPGFLPKLTFGKHYGKTFEEVARDFPDYLEWYLRQEDQDPDVAFTAEWHLKRRAA
jgi:exodeoxyribonuclease X